MFIRKNFFILVLFGCLVLASYAQTIRSVMPSLPTTIELTQAFQSHGGLTQLAFSSDGEILASVGQDARITLWNVISGQKRILQAPLNEAAIGVIFGPDGKILAGVGENAIRLWDVASGQERSTLPVHPGAAVTAVTFSPDGKTLASVGKNAEIIFWDVESGFLKRALSGHNGVVTSVAFSPDGKTLASGGQDAWTKLWDVASGQERLALPAPSGAAVTDVVFSPDGETLASVDEKAHITLWNATSGSVKSDLIGHSGVISGIAFSPDGQILASGSKNAQVTLWNVASGRERSSLLNPSGAAVIGVVFSPEGRVLASVGGDSQITLWDLTTNQPRQILAGLGDLAEVAFSSNWQTLAGIAKNGQITVWDTATGMQRFTAQSSASIALEESSASSNVAQSGSTQASAVATTASTPATEASGTGSPALGAVSVNTSQALAGKKKPSKHAWKGMTALAINPTGTLLASTSEDGKNIRLWDPTTGQNPLTFQNSLSATTTGLAFHADGIRLISVGRDTEVRFWKATSGQQLQALLGPAHPIRVVATSPDGQWVATAGEETRIMMWDAATGKLNKILSGHIDFVNGLAFSPDGKRLASAGADARLLLWDVATGQQLQTLLGHSGEINVVAFSPDGRFLVSAGEDNRIIVRDATTGQQLGAFEGQVPIRTIAFSPDGKLLASAGENTQVLMWNMETLSLSATFTGATNFINALVFHQQNKNQNYLVASCEDNQIIVWDVKDGKVRWSKRPQISSAAETPVAASANFNALALSGDSPVANPMIRPAKTVLSNPGILQRLLDWLLPVANAALSDPDVGPGGPILVINSAASPFGKYYAEILRNEGFNAFRVADIATVTAETLASYDVVILATMPSLPPAQVTMLTDMLTAWVNGGGNLIAMRPDPQLAGLLGLTAAGSPLSNGYLLVDTSRSPGNGIVNQTIQFHGAADRYTLNGASSLATLYSDATTATSNPALTLRSVGTNGGQAAAFTYDLATSVVYTRQGNPAWATQERDGYSPIRSDDKFYGNAAGDPQPDWVDLNKVAIPQADEQQRLLANLILDMNLAKKPLPRFWYFPRGKKAIVIMTGDDHGNGGTAGRWEQFKARSPAGCSVAGWECVRGTSYIYPNTPLTDAEAAAYNAEGFEVGLHINTNCADFTPALLETFYSQQIGQWTAKYGSVPAPVTQRHHCIAWSDWVTGATVQLNHGIRLDTSYYFWPPGWVLNRPGFFSGSGMPMRFSDLDGALIDVYHAATQMTDESGQQYPYTIDTLLDKALGMEGYYGAFTVNAHTDLAQTQEADAVVTSALARGAPIVSSRQMLDWLDGRNGSSFESLTWGGNALTFTVSPGTGANGLQVLVPLESSTAGMISSITSNGNPVAYTTDVIKGVNYAVFAGAAGPYTVTYAPDLTPPTVTATLPTNGATGISQGTSVKATFSEAMAAATITTTTSQLSAPGGTVFAATVSYDAATRTATLTPDVTLAASTLYTTTVKGGANGVKDLAGNALATPDVTWSFTTATGPVCPCSAWSSSTTPGTASANDPNPVELGVKFRSDVDGYITGIRFYKGSANTGTHIGNLWTTAGQNLATATFSNETASGWQQVTFSTPVPVTANTVYVASYYAPNGGYAFDYYYFATAGVDNSPIHLLRNGEDGPNGVYKYGTGGGFPTDTWNTSNYWVDVVFTTSVGPDTTPPTVVSQSPAAGATGVATGTTVTAIFSEAMDPASISVPTFELRDPNNALVVATVSYDAPSRTATLTPPDSALVANTTYPATVKGGASGVKDAAGNPLTADVTWSFTTDVASTGCATGSTIWAATVTPALDAITDGQPIEVGVKFRSNVSGYICGIRFYKGSANTGTHVGTLWSSTGQQLASATFTNETASGWQQVSFATPVAVSANTVYVASYHSSGYFADNNGYFSSAGFDNGPLHALSVGESGGNGVYQYGATSVFPASTYQGDNYWVDVVFTTSVGPDTTPPTAPTNLNATVPGATQINLTWTAATDNVGVTGYQMERCQGTGCTDFAQVATATGTSFADTGLTASTTYQYRVRAVDAAGNISNYSNVATATTPGTDTTPPTVTLTLPGSGATGVVMGTTVTATFSEAVNPATISGSTFELRDSGGTLVAATVSYTAGTNTATLTPAATLAASATYTATVKGGTGGVKDVAGNALAADYSWSFTTAAGTSPSGISIWGATTVPGNVTEPEAAAIELGVKFQASVAGYITGIRFYKGPQNTGTHVGNLWTSTGQLLATATFTNETASGWQQVSFDSPVAITANTVYMASYHTNVGYFSEDDNYFASSGVTTGPLYALRNGESGPNGVYKYGATSAFPTDTYLASNYWVDVVFTTSVGPDTTPPTVVSKSPAAGTTGVATVTTVTAAFSEVLDAATINGSTFELRDLGGSLVPAAPVSYNSSTLMATLTPSSPLALATTYTATIKGGTTDPRVKDLAGNALAADVAWTFTTAASDPCTTGNPIVQENCKQGNSSSEWDVSGAGDPSIQGFATDISVNRGQTAFFKIKTDATNYRLDIYRMGYYGGQGARKVATVQPSATLPQSQPACLTDTATKLVDCGNWAVSASWAVPSTATSGIYFAKLVRADTGGASHIIFIVRDDASTSDVLFQTSDPTWQAYNYYGGNSLYGSSSVEFDLNLRAYKVSYNRPFSTRNMERGISWVFNAEYPMVRWIEANGYDVSYFTGVDSARYGNLILNHKAFLSVGHDEYWSGQQRANVEAARDTGVHLAFFSGNSIFHKTRWENSIDGSNTAYRTLVDYKETAAGAKIDPSPEWTGTWRDPMGAQYDAGRPENGLLGNIFKANGPRVPPDAITVPAEDGKMRFWRDTGIANLAAGQTATLPAGTLGYEWEADEDNGFRPAGVIRNSTTTVNIADGNCLLDYGHTFGNCTATHALTLYRHPTSRALVFGGGTIQWSWGLDANHDATFYSAPPTDVRMQQATVNLFADMGVQPASLQSGLVAATASTDATAPTSTITSPTAGANVPVGSPVTISGTATDAGGGVVGGVEVSVDGGNTWHPANSRASWSYTWTPTTAGSVTIKSRAVDDSGNLETPSAGVPVTVGSVDTTPPTAPTGLNAAATSSTQVSLTWTTSTDNVGVTGYRVERCQGTGCSSFAQIADPTGTSFADSELTAGTTYGYRVRAADAAGNLSAYSAVATATTQSAPTPPSAVNDIFLFRANTLRTVNYAGLLGLGVLANDTDPTNQPLTAVAVGTLPTGVTLAGTGVVTINRGTATSFRYRANNGSQLSQPTTGALVTLAIDATPTAVVENCTYTRAGTGSVTGTACAMTGTRTFSMNLKSNDTDPNTTTNVPVDEVGMTVTGARITSTGTGVAVSANDACNPVQAAIVKTASRATITNNCDGTLTVTVSATAPASPITFTYGAVDDLGVQSASANRATDTVTVQ